MSGVVRLLAIIEASTVTGPAKNLLEFCRTAASLGLPLEPHIVTFVRNVARNDSGNEFIDHVRQSGIGLTAISERSGLDRKVIGRLKSAVEKFRPDIVQTHAVKSHFLLALSREWKRRVWIAFHHGYTFTDKKMLLYNELDRWSLRKPRRLVTVSKAFERQLIARGVRADRITLLQNAVNANWADRVKNVDRLAVRRRLGIGEGEQVILAVGRMSLEKAHSDLIEAFRLLRQRSPQNRRLPRLVLVGDGPERGRLEAAAGDGVVFAGHATDVSPYFAIADVMALPSLTEGSPNVLLEAMACGLPSVATEVGGTPEIVSNGESALLVPARAPERLADALQLLLEDQTLAAKIAHGGKELIRTRHSPEVRARAMFEIYRTSMDRKL